MSHKIEFFISKFQELLEQTPKSSSYYQPRPDRNGTVRFRPCSIKDFNERAELVKKTGLNVFSFPAHKIPGCDLLSDSGTTTMTQEQWAQLLLGDEAYGSNKGYFELKTQIEKTFGPEWRQDSRENLFIFHQGRAAENALFGLLSRELPLSQRRPLSDRLEESLKIRIKAKLKDRFFIVPSNSYFDTTEANIEHSMMVPLNLPCVEHIKGDENFPFRGNMNLDELKSLLEQEGDRVPLIYLTVTNNTGGGQPVSIANIKSVKELSNKHNIPLFFDACRFAENAWFIQQKEDGYQNKKIEEIVEEMFRYVDGFHISFKKDGLVNIGGGLVLKEGGLFTKKYPDIIDKITDYQILTEGNPTYGGLAGRDLKALVEGLQTIIRQDYLNYRIGQVGRFGKKLKENGIPVIMPIGGHAVYIDMDRFFEDTLTRDEEFKGIAFTALLLIAGHRLCEMGIYAFGRCEREREVPPNPRVNFVRAAVPRLTYEDQDLFSTAEAIKILHQNRNKIPGVEVIYGKELHLRHFKSRFRFM